MADTEEKKQVETWKEEDVLKWAEAANLGEKTIQVLKDKKVDGAKLLKAAEAAGISESEEPIDEASSALWVEIKEADGALANSRARGQLELLLLEAPLPPSEESKIVSGVDVDEEEPEEKEDPAKSGESKDEPPSEDTATTHTQAATTEEFVRKGLMPPTAGPAEPSPFELRMLKARLWDLVSGDSVAGGTNRLFCEGDLVKKQGNKVQTRRFILTNKCLLWCAISKKAKQFEDCRLSLKGRLDLGTFSVIDILDDPEKPKESHAFKIFNPEKDKWYILLAADAKEKQEWYQRFREANIMVMTAHPKEQTATKIENISLSVEERVEIMKMVRDHNVSVDDAMKLVDQKDAENKEKAALKAAEEKAAEEKAKEEAAAEETADKEKSSEAKTEEETKEEQAKATTTDESDKKETEETEEKSDTADKEKDTAGADE
eukprot:m.334039 g.334039  ORF g.334039 m.334039 type:complete len:433 (-) comp17274_c0_seq1:2520-3818(-)